MDLEHQLSETKRPQIRKRKQKQVLDESNRMLKRPKFTSTQYPDQDELYKFQYAGYLYRDISKKRWRVKMPSAVDGKKTNKSFADSVYGDENLSYNAAETYKRQQSTLLKLTTKKMRIDAIPLDVKSFVGGFLDGDGMISVIKSQKPRLSDDGFYCHYIVAVSFSQSSTTGIPIVLQDIQRYYGGHIFDATKKQKQIKPAYVLKISSRYECLDILQDLTKMAIIKKPQADLALDFLVNYKTYDAEKCDQICQMMAKAKHIEEYNKVAVPTRFTHSYLGGFFMAEGSIGLYHMKSGHWAPKLVFAQKNNLAILHSINAQYSNMGSVDKTSLRFTNKFMISTILRDMKPYLVGTKLIQARVMLKFCNLVVNHRYTPEQLVQIQTWSDELKSLKRI